MGLVLFCDPEDASMVLLVTLMGIMKERLMFYLLYPTIFVLFLRCDMLRLHAFLN